ncbi:Os01g0738866 [Oryza sativa Japonica Group]|uniref:Os01g0738866 protein n=1 Tax=Oryza sativa subsp. japonica TaxID=39947 RepID=A0A0P0V812_ORYSJ|nr:Os01g0738866 [Oryza sativa Japonica Group]
MATLLSDAKRVRVLAESLLLGPPGVFPTRTPNLVSTGVRCRAHREHLAALEWSSRAGRVDWSLVAASLSPQRISPHERPPTGWLPQHLTEKQRTVEKQRNRVPTPPSGIKTSGVVEDESQE